MKIQNLIFRIKKYKPGLLLLMFAASYHLASCQSQSDNLGFLERKIANNNDTISYFIFGGEAALQRKKPLLLYLQGSGANPVFTRKADGSISSSLILPPQIAGRDYHYVVITKPGYKLISEKPAQTPDEYYKKMSHYYRVDAADKVINDLVDEPFIDASKIAVVGHSEGGQIAPNIAFINKNVTHIACLSGTGTNQMYDFMVKIRKYYHKNLITKEEADNQIDSLFYFYRDIMEHPKSTDKFWAGHTYLRWSSAIENPPLKYLKQLDIPIYIVAGTKDDSSPIEDMDNIPIEFLARRKENLTYRYYWDYDHIYNEIDPESGNPKGSRIVDVMKEVISWLNEN